MIDDELNENGEPESDPESPVYEESESGSTEPEPVPAPVYEITVVPESRPFLTTDFEDYTVTEGLLLLLVLILFIVALARLVRRCFSWLLW